MPTAYAYCHGDHAAALEAAYRQHLAQYWQWGGITSDAPGPFDTLAGWALLDRRLGQDDQVLLMDLEVLGGLRDATDALASLSARQVGVFCVASGVHLNHQTDTGRNAAGLARLLAALPNHVQRVAHNTTDTKTIRIAEGDKFIGYGYSRYWHPGNKQWRTEPNPAMRRQMAMIVELRDGGLSWHEIAKLLGQRCLRWKRGVAWSRERVCAAYQKEMELRQYEQEYRLSAGVHRQAG